MIDDSVIQNGIHLPNDILEFLKKERFFSQHADKIAVLEGGALIDIGNHQSLMKSCELYQRLVTLQFKHLE